MTDWTTVLKACSRTLAFISAPRRTGVPRNRFSVPRSISSIVPMPAHMLDETAFITTTPGTRYVRYDAAPNPGSSTTLRNRLPNRKSQIIGWISVKTSTSGWRDSALSRRWVIHHVSTVSVVIAHSHWLRRNGGRRGAGTRRPGTGGRP